MAYQIERGRAPRAPRVGIIALIVTLLIVLLGARSMASYAIEIAWWKELGQFRHLDQHALLQRGAGHAGHPARVRRFVDDARARA